MGLGMKNSCFNPITRYLPIATNENGSRWDDNRGVSILLLGICQLRHTEEVHDEYLIPVFQSYY